MQRDLAPTRPCPDAAATSPATRPPCGSTLSDSRLAVSRLHRSGLPRFCRAHSSAPGLVIPLSALKAAARSPNASTQSSYSPRLTSTPYRGVLWTVSESPPRACEFSLLEERVGRAAVRRSLAVLTRTYLPENIWVTVTPRQPRLTQRRRQGRRELGADSLHTTAVAPHGDPSDTRRRLAGLTWGNGTPMSD